MTHEWVLFALTDSCGCQFKNATAREFWLNLVTLLCSDGLLESMYCDAGTGEGQ